ncbi:MAG: DUF418 domain-containing protein [Sphingomonadaceae bacterium]
MRTATGRRLTPVAPAGERIAALDAVRGVALFGVLLVNLTTEFRVSIFQQFLPPVAAGSALDVALARAIALALEGKAFALFSLLFGVGMAIQYEQFAVRGRALYWMTRRLLVLLGFGLLHLLLLWNGDILTEYAVVGLLVLPALRWRTTSLLLAALACLLWFGAQSLLPWTVQWPDAATLQQQVAQANLVYASAGYLEIVRFSFAELALLLPLHLYVMPRTMALFLFGMLVWRSGVLQQPSRYVGRLRGIAVAGGVAAVLLARWGSGDGDGAATWASLLPLLPMVPVLLCFAYGAALLALMQWTAPRRVLLGFAPLGRMAFTNYLMQSVLGGWLFFGYGLGWFGHLAVAPVCALALVVYLAQMALSSYWLRHFRYGPLEWLWRLLARGRGRISPASPL